MASKAFTAPHHRPDPDAAPEKTPLEIAEEKREALKFLAGYRMLQILLLQPLLRIKSVLRFFGWGDAAERNSPQVAELQPIFCFHFEITLP